MLYKRLLSTIAAKYTVQVLLSINQHNFELIWPCASLCHEMMPNCIPGSRLWSLTCWLIVKLRLNFFDKRFVILVTWKYLTRLLFSADFVNLLCGLGHLEPPVTPLLTLTRYDTRNSYNIRHKNARTNIKCQYISVHGIIVWCDLKCSIVPSLATYGK